MLIREYYVSARFSDQYGNSMEAFFRVKAVGAAEAWEAVHSALAYSPDRHPESVELVPNQASV